MGFVLLLILELLSRLVDAPVSENITKLNVSAGVDSQVGLDQMHLSTRKPPYLDHAESTRLLVQSVRPPSSCLRDGYFVFRVSVFDVLFPCVEKLAEYPQCHVSLDLAREGHFDGDGMGKEFWHGLLWALSDLTSR
jgi:hypothetical protein